MATHHQVKSGEQIISDYMEYVSNLHLVPDESGFLTTYGISEENFAEYFDSISDLEKLIWAKLMEQAIITVQSDNQYADYTLQEKVLSLCYTFFENLTLNRNYLLKNLHFAHSIKNKKELLSDMKRIYTEHINHLFRNDGNALNQDILHKFDGIRRKTISEGFWLQLTLLITFWRKDRSPNLEKTDAAIEKSVQVAMDLVDTSRVRNFIDLGKFLWSERATMNKDDDDL